jgi:hypothetical protein
MQPYSPGAASSYVDRLRGALMLDPRVYREVEQDTNANGQAALTVILAALAAGIGSFSARSLAPDALGVAVSSFGQWVIFSFVAYFVGTSMFATEQTSVTPGQVLRTIGFAQAPKFLMVLGVIPVLGGIAALIALLWFLAAAVTALREAFEFETGRAVATGLVALVVIAVVDVILGIVFGISSAIFGSLASIFR